MNSRTIENRSCPLCESPAVCYDVDHGDKDYFKCNRCGRFIISTTAESRVLQMPIESRRALSDAARAAPEGEVLVIRKATFGQPEWEVSVVTEIEPKSNWRL